MQSDGSSSHFQFSRQGRWRLWVRPQIWSPGLWAMILDQLEGAPPTGHPRTKRLRYPQGENGREFYLKIHHQADLPGRLKDLFRDSKALRALKQGAALSRQGFSAPLGVAAGEERKLGLLSRAFLLTVKLEGSSLLHFLQDHYSFPLGPRALKQKRTHLKRLAMEIRRLHQSGFVHGDLVPSNVFMQELDDEIVFSYLDHDRTRCYPGWFPHGLWKRNLVQLNRFALPGISLQDRVRFLKCYLGATSWEKRERRLIRWLEKKTRRRRRECEGIQAEVSFRELMRWNGPFSRSLWKRWDVSSNIQ